MQKKLEWATTYFLVLVATQCVLLRQVGRRCVPRSTRLGVTWLGLRVGASNIACDSTARARDLIFLGPRSQHQFLCCDMAGMGQAGIGSRYDFYVAIVAVVGGVATWPWRRDTKAAKEEKLVSRHTFGVATEES